MRKGQTKGFAASEVSVEKFKVSLSNSKRTRGLLFAMCAEWRRCEHIPEIRDVIEEWLFFGDGLSPKEISDSVGVFMRYVPLRPDGETLLRWVGRDRNGSLVRGLADAGYPSLVPGDGSAMRMAADKFPFFVNSSWPCFFDDEETESIAKNMIEKFPAGAAQSVVSLLSRRAGAIRTETCVGLLGLLSPEERVGALAAAATPRHFDAAAKAFELSEGGLSRTFSGAAAGCGMSSVLSVAEFADSRQPEYEEADQCSPSHIRRRVFNAAFDSVLEHGEARDVFELVKLCGSRSGLGMATGRIGEALEKLSGCEDASVLRGVLNMPGVDAEWRKKTVARFARAVENGEAISGSAVFIAFASGTPRGGEESERPRPERIAEVVERIAPEDVARMIADNSMRTVVNACVSSILADGGNASTTLSALSGVLFSKLETFASEAVAEWLKTKRASPGEENFPAKLRLAAEMAVKMEHQDILCGIDRDGRSFIEKLGELLRRADMSPFAAHVFEHGVSLGRSRSADAALERVLNGDGVSFSDVFRTLEKYEKYAEKRLPREETFARLLASAKEKCSEHGGEGIRRLYNLLTELCDGPLSKDARVFRALFRDALNDVVEILLDFVAGQGDRVEESDARLVFFCFKRLAFERSGDVPEALALKLFSASAALVPRFAALADVAGETLHFLRKFAFGHDGSRKLPDGRSATDVFETALLETTGNPDEDAVCAVLAELMYQTVSRDVFSDEFAVFVSSLARRLLDSPARWAETFANGDKGLYLLRAGVFLHAGVPSSPPASSWVHALVEADTCGMLSARGVLSCFLGNEPLFRDNIFRKEPDETEKILSAASTRLVRYGTDSELRRLAPESAFLALLYADSRYMAHSVKKLLEERLGVSRSNAARSWIAAKPFFSTAELERFVATMGKSSLSAKDKRGVPELDVSELFDKLNAHLDSVSSTEDVRVHTELIAGPLRRLAEEYGGIHETSAYLGAVPAKMAWLSSVAEAEDSFGTDGFPPI